MIAVTDIAYVRLGAPDFDEMRRFLEIFGMQITEATDTRMYARGTNAMRYLHVTEKGDPGLRALGLQAATAADLEKLAKTEGASAIEDLTSPGGGHRISFSDPSGHRVEVVHGIEPLPAIEPQRRPPFNFAESPRTGEPVRLPKRPSAVKRLGHCVLNVVDAQESERWYRELFGFIPSDSIHLDGEPKPLGSFLRCNRGERYVDHHTLFLVGAGEAGLNHIAFEVQDWDDLMLGHDALQDAGYEHRWGVGKHILGSQIFDYWHDPFGHAIEHFTDGDLFNEAQGSNKATLEDLLGVQWGPAGHP